MHSQQNIKFGYFRSVCPFQYYFTNGEKILTHNNTTNTFLSNNTFQKKKNWVKVGNLQTKQRSFACLTPSDTIVLNSCIHTWLCFTK